MSFQSLLMKMVGILALLLAAPARAGADGPASAPQRIHVYDMTALYALNRGDAVQARIAWDTAHLVASIQGIVNRDRARLFVRFMKETDDFWFEQLRRQGEWLAGTEAVAVGGLDDLLTLFAKDIRGVVVYDERVAATSNLASTIAGIEDRIVLRHDADENSLCQRVLRSGRFKDVLRLMNEDGSAMFTGRGLIPGTTETSSGSAKCDAYLWAKARYMDTGRCSGSYMAYYMDAWWLRDPVQCPLDNHTLTNHDFFISQRAFFFDLGVWEEESPVDDPGQAPGTDVGVLRKLLRSMHDRGNGRIIHIGGFVPWAWKYTSHSRAGSKHHPVDSEWKYAQIISAYNGIMDADAIGISGMANASFYQHFPLKERYPQNRKPTVEDLKRKGLIGADGSVAENLYVLFYIGDYDSAAWLNVHVPRFWKDPARGTIPAAWAFNPNLDRRAPHAMDYARRHASANDWFIAGDSGAGYLNPGMLLKPRLDEDLPSGMEAWVEHNLPYYRRYDLSITGFIIDGHSREMGQAGLDAYSRFSADGIIGQKLPAGQGVHRGRMPFARMKTDLDGNPKSAGTEVATMAGVNLPKFAAVRTILKSPTWHKQTMEHAKASPGGERIVFVDPYTFFLLLKAHEQGKAQANVEARQAVSFTAPAARDGLSPIIAGDGAFGHAEHDGRAVVRQSAAGKTRYLYFEAANGFAHTGADLRVVVTLFDGSAATLGLEYDSSVSRANDPHRGAYTSTAAQALPGSKQWIEVKFDLKSAGFAHRQNGGADFRLVNFGADLMVHKVIVERASRPLEALRGVRRIAFFGDSITWSGGYIGYLDAFLATRFPEERFELLNLGLPSETASGLSEPGHVKHGFARPGVHERLDRALAKVKPDLVVACYGMNDGIYLPLDEARFASYRQGMVRLVEGSKASGAKVIVLTPPPFDPVPLKGRLAPGVPDGPFEKYDEVLGRYSAWLLDQRKGGWQVIDLHGPMNRHVAERRKEDGGYILAGDGVHTSAFGHWLMAQEILLAWQAMGEADVAEIDAPSARATRGRVSDLTISDREIRFAWQTRLPMPMDGSWDERAVDQERIVARLNRHTLIVRGAAGAAYELYEGERRLGTVSADDLNQGVDLVRFKDLSTNARAKEVLKLVQQRQGMLRDAWLSETGHVRPGLPKGLPLEAALRQAGELDGKIRQLAADATLRLRLVEVAR